MWPYEIVFDKVSRRTVVATVRELTSDCERSRSEAETCGDGERARSWSEKTPVKDNRIRMHPKQGQELQARNSRYWVDRAHQVVLDRWNRQHGFRRFVVCAKSVIIKLLIVHSGFAWAELGTESSVHSLLLAGGQRHIRSFWKQFLSSIRWFGDIIINHLSRTLRLCVHYDCDLTRIKRSGNKLS